MREPWNLLRAIIRRLTWLTARVETLEERLNIMTTDQEHLDQDVANIDAKFSDAIQHLKDQIANGVPAAQLDFSKADALSSKADAEDATDNPPAAAGGVTVPSAGEVGGIGSDSIPADVTSPTPNVPPGNVIP